MNVQLQGAEKRQVLDTLPLTGRIGAEIRGVTLSGVLDAGTVAAIRAALLEYKVIFFRGQSHLDDDAHEAFSRLLGEPAAYHAQPAGKGALIDIDPKRSGRSDSWHTDATFALAYPAMSILRAKIVPPYGGDTLWANTAAAYAELPEGLRALADRLWAVHSNQYDYAATRPGATETDTIEYRKLWAATPCETRHPIVRVHPETGERALVLGHFITSLVGYSPRESASLLGVLGEWAIRPENTVRWRWSQDDVTIWDNRATQHYATRDYGDRPRLMRRVMLQGDVPVSVDGRHSIPCPAVNGLAADQAREDHAIGQQQQ